MNRYIAYDKGVSDIDLSYLKSRGNETYRTEKIEDNCNTFERLSEQLCIVHVTSETNKVKEALTYAN